MPKPSVQITERLLYINLTMWLVTFKEDHIPVFNFWYWWSNKSMVFRSESVMRRKDYKEPKM